MNTTIYWPESPDTHLPNLLLGAVRHFLHLPLPPPHTHTRQVTYIPTGPQCVASGFTFPHIYPTWWLVHFVMAVRRQLIIHDISNSEEFIPYNIHNFTGYNYFLRYQGGTTRNFVFVPSDSHYPHSILFTWVTRWVKLLMKEARSGEPSSFFRVSYHTETWVRRSEWWGRRVGRPCAVKGGNNLFSIQLSICLQ